MSGRRFLLALCAGLCHVAAGQNYDVLENAPRTAIYVQTDYEGNDDRPGCDWYLSGDELLAGALPPAGRGCQVLIRLRGTINRAGAAHFADIVARLAATAQVPTAVVLDSRGGDTDAAIEIGRTIRGHDLFRGVPEGIETRIADDYDAVCFSGCVVVFAAGQRRNAAFDIDGNPALPSRLGIHSPGQFDRNAGRYDSSADNAEVLRVTRRLRAYFASVDVDDAIVDDMLAVPFDDLRLLTESDLRRYRLIP